MITSILVIADNANEQFLYRNALKDAASSFTLTMASSAASGFLLLDEVKPDIILLDYNLPDMDGLGFMKKLGEMQDSPIPIVMLSGESDPAVAVEAMKNGVDDYLVKDVNGKYLKMLPGVVGHVMAAHHQREQLMRWQREHEALLRRNQILMQNSLDGIHIMDAQGNVVDANDAFCNMLGYSREEVLQLNIIDWDVQWSAAEMKERLHELLGSSAQFETVHRRKDGTLIDVEISSSWKEIDGKYFLFAAGRDITERKRVEAIQRQHKRVIDTSIDGFWMTDLEGNLLEANEAYAALSGYNLEELAHMHISQLEAIERSPADVQVHIAKVIEQGYDRFETRHRHKDGHEIEIEISVTYLEEPPRLVVFARDISARKTVELRLRKSEANLRAMLDNSPYLTWLKDVDGCYITINKVFTDFLGLDNANLAIGKTDLELQPRELAEKYRLDDLEVMSARRQKHVEESAFDGDATRWVETFKTPIVGEDGEVMGTVGFARDITERKLSEELLKASEASLKDLFENLSSAVAVYQVSQDGQDFIFSSFNRAAEQIENIRRESLIGKNVVGISPDVVEFGLLEVFRRVWRSGVKERFSTTFYNNGRLEKWRENYVYKLPNGEIAAIYDDITKEKQAEEKLLQEKQFEHLQAEKLAQQFGYLLQSSFNEIYMFDAESLEFILTSQGAEKNLGYSEEELNLLTPLDLGICDTRENFDELVLPLKTGEQQLLFIEARHRRKNGTEYPIEMHLQLMKAAPPMFIAVVQDITERDHAAQQLRELMSHMQTVREEEKANIAREVHDDLGSTLTALKMDAYWLASKLETSKRLLPLYTCAKSMVTLLDNAVLTTRRIITDLRPTILDEVGLMAALKWQCTEFQNRTGIVCKCQFAENAITESCLDRTRLINLFRISQEALTNVARHSGASKVTINLVQDEKTISLTIADNGKGMPKKQALPSTSYGLRGMRERVVQMSGKIKFDSPARGGFKVSVTLPLLPGNP